METILFFYILLSLFFYSHSQNCCSSVNSLSFYSLIDIPFRIPGDQIKYPAYPSFVLNSTFYSLINGKKFKLIKVKEGCKCDHIKYYDEFVINDFSPSDIAQNFVYKGKSLLMIKQLLLINLKCADYNSR